MRQYRRKQEQAKRKADHQLSLALAANLPIEELVSRAREDIESFAAEIGLTIIRQVMEAEIQEKVGRWANNRSGAMASSPGM